MQRPFSTSIALLWILALSVAAGWAQANPAGNFANETLQISLKPDGKGLKGTAYLQGQRYPVRLQGQNGQYIGYYVDGGQRYPLQALYQNGTLQLYTDGQTYFLQRVKKLRTARRSRALS